MPPCIKKITIHNHISSIIVKYGIFRYLFRSSILMRISLKFLKNVLKKLNLLEMDLELLIQHSIFLFILVF